MPSPRVHLARPLVAWLLALWLLALGFAGCPVSAAAAAASATADSTAAAARVMAPVRPEAPEDWIGFPLPVLAGKALQGPNLRTSEYAGEVVLLVFWASWCGRCEEELGRIQALHATYRGAGLAVLGVNLDDSLPVARDFAAGAGVGFPVMHDLTKRISRRFALLDLPTLVLVDRGGTVRQVYGRLDRKGRKALVDDIRQLLDE